MLFAKHSKKSCQAYGTSTSGTLGTLCERQDQNKKVKKVIFILIKEFSIKNFRSIENIKISFPNKKPVILFGPNNAGKSNILKAFDIFLGEKYTPYYNFLDSDYFFRNKNDYPKIKFSAKFNDDYYSGNRYNPALNTICFTTNKEIDGNTENCFHSEFDNKVYLSNDDREKCQFILIDATRNIKRQFSYFSKYSILSKMSKKMHNALIESQKQELNEHFEIIKDLYENVPEYIEFYTNLQNAFESNIDGFEHKLEIDLSAYDPNNYFHSLKIIAKENDDVRAFDEFGTGEQQILLMSFIKAYAETFKSENFILGIEEPEAHLHPLAQRWFAKNINNLCENGIQVVLTTHSPELLNIKNLEGFVKVNKINGITTTIQNDTDDLTEKCIELGSNPQRTNSDSILPYYKSNTFYDQLRGFFARKIIFVEGSTELFSLPNYFNNCGFDLIKNGVEIINCRGKTQITRNYRLYKSYNYSCFCLFDGDSNKGNNNDFANTFNFEVDQMDLRKEKCTINLDNKYGYFGKDFENYMRKNFDDYREKEQSIGGSKPLRAKIISETNDYQPVFIEKIAESLNLEKD